MLRRAAAQPRARARQRLAGVRRDPRAVRPRADRRRRRSRSRPKRPAPAPGIVARVDGRRAHGAASRRWPPPCSTSNCAARARATRVRRRRAPREALPSRRRRSPGARGARPRRSSTREACELARWRRARSAPARRPADGARGSRALAAARRRGLRARRRRRHRAARASSFGAAAARRAASSRSSGAGAQAGASRWRPATCSSSTRRAVRVRARRAAGSRAGGRAARRLRAMPGRRAGRRHARSPTRAFLEPRARRGGSSTWRRAPGARAPHAGGGARGPGEPRAHALDRVGALRASRRSTIAPGARHERGRGGGARRLPRLARGRLLLRLPARPARRAGAAARA